MYSDRATLERLSVASANDLIAELEAGRWPLDQAEAAKIVAAGERAAAAGERLATAAPAPAVYENPLDDDDATDVPFVPAGSEPTEAERTRDQLATIDDLVRRLGATPADLDNVVYKRYQCTTAELDEHKRLDLIAHLSKRAAEHTPA